MKKSIRNATLRRNSQQPVFRAVLRGQLSEGVERNRLLGEELAKLKSEFQNESDDHDDLRLAVGPVLNRLRARLVPAG